MTNSSNSNSHSFRDDSQIAEVLQGFFRQEVPAALSEPFDPAVRRVARLREMQSELFLSQESPGQRVSSQHPPQLRTSARSVVASASADRGRRNLAAVSAVASLAACVLFLTSLNRQDVNHEQIAEKSGLALSGNHAGVEPGDPQADLMPVSEQGGGAELPATTDGTTLHELQGIEIKPQRHD